MSDLVRTCKVYTCNDLIQVVCLRNLFARAKCVMITMLIRSNG